jgi:hypothetical protein
MIATITFAALAVLALAVPARAGSLIVTPPLRPPAGGSVQCLVANASATKTVEYTATIYNFDGLVKASTSTTLEPNRNLTTIAGTITQGHCVVEVLRGGKKNVRVSLEMSDAGDNVLAAVPGQ